MSPADAIYRGVTLRRKAGEIGLQILIIILADDRAFMSVTRASPCADATYPISRKISDRNWVIDRPTTCKEHLCRHHYCARYLY